MKPHTQMMSRRQPRRGSSTYVAVYYSGGRVVPHGHTLQAFLNQFASVELAEDGQLGPRSSDAFRLVTGYYLMGDPRAASHDQPGPNVRDVDHILAV